ncbi:hypothetical protein SNE40_020033 [Patella caerulea]
MRSWCESMRKGMALRFITFIRKSLPTLLLYTETKNNLIKYLQDHWFQSILHREAEYAKNIPDTFKPSLKDKTKESKLATVGINLVPRVEAIGASEDGWFLVEPNSKDSESLVHDEFVLLNRKDGEHFLIDHDYYETKPILHDNIKKQTENLNAKAGDTNLKCKNLIKLLTDLICSHFRTETLKFIPSHLSNSVNNNNNHKYICNIKLCTCLYFIIRGQPYFCKHLYACLSFHHGEKDLDKLLELYLTTVPTIPSYLDSFGVGKVIQPRQPVLDRVNLLEEMVHPVTLLDTEKLKKGKLLNILHNFKIKCTNYSGPLAHKQPHNMGNRRKDGPIKPDHYSLIEPEDIQNDPYRPHVKFPENAHERHGGRKRIKSRNRGRKFNKIVQEAYLQLGKHVTLCALENDHNNEVIIDNCLDDTEISIKNINSNNNTICYNEKNHENRIPRILKKQEIQKNIMCRICLDNNIKPIFRCST